MKKNLGLILGISAAALALGLLIARTVFPELVWLTAIVGVALLGVLAVLIRHNFQALRSRSAAYGFNSVITVLLVLGILGVLNFLGSRYPQKLDLTKNRTNTLSDQTVKLIKGLKTPVKAVMFTKLAQREQVRPLLDNYKNLNSGKFDVEYVDPDKEPTRTKQAGIRKYNTLLLNVSGRENRIEDPTEEKLTNSLIKLTQDRTPTLCSITGHGEKSFSSTEADGYDTAKKALEAQSYVVKEINLTQDAKALDSCDTVAIIGPTKSFFDPEVKTLRAYLANGGRAVVALDLNVTGNANEYSPELVALLEPWGIKPVKALVVDPLSKLLGVDAAVPLLSEFNKESAITRDFQTNCYFPFARPIDIAPPANGGPNPVWLGKTTQKSFAVMNLKEIASGQVTFQPGRDRQGPISVAVSVDGKAKDSKASRNTRLVVFGSSNFANNNYSRFGGNIDFFLNSVSWAMEDESLISIRAKEEGPGKVELTQKTGAFIFLLTVIIIPILVAVGGIVVWVLRKRL